MEGSLNEQVNGVGTNFLSREGCDGVYRLNPFSIGAHFYHEFGMWLDGFIGITKDL